MRRFHRDTTETLDTGPDPLSNAPMNPTRTYDYLTLARRRVFDWVRPITPEQYTREFPIGPGSFARTLTHIMISEWYYIERLLRREVPPYEQWPIRQESPPPFDAIERTWTAQAERTRAAIASVADWDEPLEYDVTDDDGRPFHITATPGDIVTQLALHEVHHRAQVMNMLRQLGVKLEDIDFNAIMYTRREVS